MGDKEAAADAFLIRALRGPEGWPVGIDPACVVARAVFHGVAGALGGRSSAWPAEAADPLRRHATARTMWEMRHRQVLAPLLAELASAGVRALVLKGSALAYDLYDAPHARARGDSDLLVAPPDLAAARRVLAARGLSRAGDGTDADAAVRREETWTIRTVDGLDHDIDLHWQALNAPALAGVIGFEEAWARARPLPRLGPGAAGLPLDLALILACAHRAVHMVSPYHVDGRAHRDGNRLVWLLDIDLLARALDPAGWELVVAAARTRGVARATLDGLAATAARLGSPVPPQVLSDLAACPLAAPDRYLGSGRLVERLWLDLVASPGLGGRLGYLRAGLVPSAAYMRSRYPERASHPLPLLHARRIAGFLRRHAFRR